MRSNKGFGPLTGLALAVAAVIGTGCGDLTIRTWVKVITAESTGRLIVPDFGVDAPIERLQGGFYGNVRVSTRDLLNALEGTITLEDTRIAADNPELAGELCIWGNPAAPSTGTVSIDILSAAGSASLVANLKAHTALSVLLGIDPLEVSQALDFELGGGIGIEEFLNAALDGSPDGLFATTAAFVGEAELGGLPATFDLQLAITNEGTPPKFDADLLTFCAEFFDEQGREQFWSVNSKGSYLLHSQVDNPQTPLRIPLADIGAAPGAQLRLARVGTFSPTTELRDGDLTGLIGVFSRDANLASGGKKTRVNAVEAGSDIRTGTVLRCLLILCIPQSTDIPQDFRIDPNVTVTVPANATHLFIMPLPRVLLFQDNSGFGFGVDVTVNP
jgi:hypothetical protein